jgi:RNA polymerase sigma-19 factor, ECF subfamily
LIKISGKQRSDKDILALMRSDPQQGFELLFHAFYAEVCRHIYRYVPNRSVVEDIAQELFAELWTKRDTLNISISPGAYLHRMAVTRSLNYIRDNKKHLYESDDALKISPSNMSTAHEELSATELSVVITQAIDSLPDRCRHVFMLSRFEDMSNAAIAKELDISVKTVENQMTKALKVLRNAVDIYRNTE